MDPTERDDESLPPVKTPSPPPNQIAKQPKANPYPATPLNPLQLQAERIIERYNRYHNAAPNPSGPGNGNITFNPIFNPVFNVVTGDRASVVGTVDITNEGGVVKGKIDGIGRVEEEKCQPDGKEKSKVDQGDNRSGNALLKASDMNTNGNQTGEDGLSTGPKGDMMGSQDGGEAGKAETKDGSIRNQGGRDDAKEEASKKDATGDQSVVDDVKIKSKSNTTGIEIGEHNAKAESKDSTPESHRNKVAEEKEKTIGETVTCGETCSAEHATSLQENNKQKSTSRFGVVAVILLFVALVIQFIIETNPHLSRTIQSWTTYDIPNSTIPTQPFTKLLPPTHDILSRNLDGTSYRAAEALNLTQSLLATLETSSSFSDSLFYDDISTNLTAISHSFSTLVDQGSTLLFAINNIVSKDIFTTISNTLLHLHHHPEDTMNTTIHQTTLTNITSSLRLLTSHLTANLTNHYTTLQTHTSNLQQTYTHLHGRLEQEGETYNADLDRQQRSWFPRKRDKKALLLRHEHLARKVDVFVELWTGMLLLECVRSADHEAINNYVEEVAKAMGLVAAATAIARVATQNDHIDLRKLYNLEISPLMLRDISTEDGITASVLKKSYGMRSRTDFCPFLRPEDDQVIIEEEKEEEADD